MDNKMDLFEYNFKPCPSNISLSAALLKILPVS